jgi:hypothetical protein
MDLYQDVYGATRLRLVVELTIWFLGAIFGLLLVAGIRWQGTWLPRAAVAVGLIAVIGFGVSNPDARIAGRNVQRFVETGDIDVAYLSGLSTDAVPALRRLPEPQRRCVIGAILARLPRGNSLWSFNLSRRLAATQIEAEGSLGCNTDFSSL